MKKLPEIKFNDRQINPTKIEILPFEVLENKIGAPIDHNPYKPHRLKFNAIFFVIDGKEGIHNIDFENYVFAKGDIILVAKEQIHSFIDLPQNNNGFLLLFTEELFLEVGATYPLLINHLYNNQLYDPVLDLEEEKFIELQELTLKIKKEIKGETKPIRLEIAKSYLKVLLLEIFYWREKKNNLIEKTPYLKAFIKFQELLKNNLQNERKVKFYAEKLNVTTKQLNKITQSTINLSAKDYIISSVILEAKKYLRCSKLSSKEIAYKLGFDEPTNFTKFFKKHTELLPSEFVESV